jgi:outer membrane protein OmpA-like peptidoglycan-associated protein
MVRSERMSMSSWVRMIGVAVLVLCAMACRPTPGPDKTVVGATLGAGWGAGAGAVIGNQVNATGAGAAIGAGFGAVSGAVTGVGLDISEGNELAMQRELDVLRVQVAANNRSLRRMQSTLDDRTRSLTASNPTGVIYFDEGQASLRLGSVEQLQRLSEAIKVNPYVGIVEVHGHSDDLGNSERNERLSEARSRTVASFLGSQGISMGQIKLFSHGASRPVASNESEPGRQLNRRVEVVVTR